MQNTCQEDFSKKANIYLKEIVCVTVGNFTPVNSEINALSSHARWGLGWIRGLHFLNILINSSKRIQHPNRLSIKPPEYARLKRKPASSSF